MTDTEILERANRKIDRQGPDACWPWTGYTDGKGYGQLSVGPRGGRRVYLAHRLAYEAAKGPVPVGLDVGHRCHDRDLTCAGGADCLHRRCCNPRHLEAQERVQNVRTGTLGRVDRCKRGHPFDAANTYITRATGRRSCRKCRAYLQRRWQAAHKEGAEK